MKIGFFTDTYFPQVSGVATSIQTLKEQLERHGHEVYIFTTTDPKAPKDEPNIIRMPSVPFISFKERRIVVRGMWFAYQTAKELNLDLIHTHTEFGAGLLGKWVGKKLEIPVIHTYHTMYEDYIHYIAKGKVLRPSYVKYLSRQFVDHSTGVVCPSQRVVETLRGYGATALMRVIPTGIKLEKFNRPEITPEKVRAFREKWGITDEHTLLLSLSRLSYEKKIHVILQALPTIIEKRPEVRLMIVGGGPYEEELRAIVEKQELGAFVYFIGEVASDEVACYYYAADYFVSASTSETQGLTYTEAMAAKLQMVVAGNAYLDHLLSDPSLGVTYQEENDFAPCLLDYIESNIAMDEEKLEKKMHEISAEYFGQSMLEFYEEMRLHYTEVQAEKKKKGALEGKIKNRLESFKILVK
ncbi:glycosyltransferase family 4 protein [Enterococcus sp. LJL98]